MKININVLPSEYRPRRWVLPVTMFLVVAVAATGYYGYNFYGKKAAAQSELDQLQEQLDTINAETLRVIGETQSPIGDLEDQIAAAQAELYALGGVERDYEKWNAERIYWTPVLQAVGQLAPSDAIFQEFRQVGSNREISVSGRLGGEVQNAIILSEYQKRLEQYGIFSRVLLEIGTDTEDIGDGKTREFFTFTITLEVKPGG